MCVTSVTRFGHSGPIVPVEPALVELLAVAPSVWTSTTSDPHAASKELVARAIKRPGVSFFMSATNAPSSAPRQCATARGARAKIHRGEDEQGRSRNGALLTPATAS